MRGKTVFLLLNLLASTSLLADELPENLVLDIRVFESRSLTPDFQAMQKLSFFINTDGLRITEQQWLGTIAQQVTESYVATLAYETLPVEGGEASLRLETRSQSLDATVDLSGFLPRGVFDANVLTNLESGGESARSFEREIELRLGQTFVWSGPGLELSASEYLSYFRDYDDGDHRSAFYDSLRDFTVFLIFAATPRMREEVPSVVELDAPASADLNLESPIGIDMVGTINLELELDSKGKPEIVRIRRSSIPEANPWVVNEASGWQFPEAAGRTGRVEIDLRAEPR